MSAELSRGIGHVPHGNKNRKGDLQIKTDDRPVFKPPVRTK
jgi:hypothetical protein